MTIITIHRLENLQITDHRDLKLCVHTSQKILLSQITGLNFAFSQITDFKKGQSHVTEKSPAPPFYKADINQFNSIKFNSIQFFIQIAKYILAHLQNNQYKYTNLTYFIVSTG